MSEADLAVLVAWRSRGSLHSGPIDVNGDVAGEFRESTDAVLNKFEDLAHAVTYDPDVEYDAADDQVLLAGREDVLDAELMDVLFEAHVNDAVTGRDLAQRKPILHAVSRGSGDGRAVLVRSTSPVKFAEKSIRGFLSDSFDRVQEPILVFDDKYDFVIYRDRVVILNPAAFERITNTPASAEAASGRLVEGLKQALSIHPDSLESLKSKLISNSFLRRKALSVINKPYLESLTMAQVRDALALHDLQPTDFIDGTQLRFEAENVRTLLVVLNEDVFSGDFSGTEYAASRKSKL